MLRRSIALVVVITVGAALGAPAAQAQDPVPPATPDHMLAYAVDPPGQDGNLNAQETGSGDYGPHFDDQLEMYASLIDSDGVTEADLSKYFHSFQFGPGPTIESTDQPVDGVTIFRDGFGVPHIYADTLEHASYGLGLVTAEDRMFEMDVFRHAARGTLSTLLGPGTDNAYLNMDIDTRQQGYTEEEVQKMFDSFDDKYGALGERVQRGLEQYAAGVNDYASSLAMNPAECPVEYQATGNPCPGPFPEEWTPLDTLYIAILQLRVFGETAGGELRNAAFYSAVTDKVGTKLGTKVYNDLLFQNDPKSPPTVPRSEGKFPSQNLGKLNPKSLAIPDHAARTARRVAAREESYKDTLASIGIRFAQPESNALLVGATKSATGNPLQTGGPQVGYAVPNFFIEVDVHVTASADGPAVDFRGPAVAGASALIPLGRGSDYAWTLTTGYSDAVDTRAELLCEPEGGKASLNSNGYMFKGKCKAMESREETFAGHVAPTDPTPPDDTTRTFYRTVHGPVLTRGSVDGKPVAFVKERFFWKKEVDSIPAFYGWNTDGHTVKTFGKWASKLTMSFNTFYANTKDVAYFHVGEIPKRHKGVSPTLPTWGTGQWEWGGRFPFKDMPHVTNPKRGWIANWNSKPATGWNTADDFKWGTIQRVHLLEDDLGKVVAKGGKATLVDLVNVLRNVATRDVRGVYLGPQMLKLAGSQEGDAGAAIELVKKWVSEGARRMNRDRDDNEDSGNALAIFDGWYTHLVHNVFDDEIGEAAYASGPPVTDYTPDHGSSFYFDFSSYLYDLFGNGAKRYSLNYCDDRSTKPHEKCKDMVIKSLNDALAELKTAQGADMAAWTTPAEWIVFPSFGASDPLQIPWQNRGTHNHIVELGGTPAP
jgi:acyl-homoserine lactone acylase PvdQ